MSFTMNHSTLLSESVNLKSFHPFLEYGERAKKCFNPNHLLALVVPRYRAVHMQYVPNGKLWMEIYSKARRAQAICAKGKAKDGNLFKREMKKVMRTDIPIWVTYSMV